MYLVCDDLQSASMVHGITTMNAWLEAGLSRCRNVDIPLLLGVGAAGFLAGAVSHRFLARKRRRARDVPEDQVIARLTFPSEFDAPRVSQRVLRKAETVLRRRTATVLLVLERTRDSHNYSAVLRTCEALGIQHVWIIDPPSSLAPQRTGRRKGVTLADIEARETHAMFARRAQEFLSVRSFATTTACIDALREDERTLWATDLSQAAYVLDAEAPWVRARPLPTRLALVMGTESSGISDEMRTAADRLVYLPLSGFADSLNLSVAAALCLHTTLGLYGRAALIGAGFEDGELQRLRKAWYAKLARSPEQRVEYAALASTPPIPFDDLRRCEEHRIPFIKKSRLVPGERIDSA